MLKTAAVRRLTGRAYLVHAMMIAKREMTEKIVVRNSEYGMYFHRVRKEGSRPLANNSGSIFESQQRAYEIIIITKEVNRNPFAMLLNSLCLKQADKIRGNATML